MLYTQLRVSLLSCERHTFREGWRVVQGRDTGLPKRVGGRLFPFWVPWETPVLSRAGETTGRAPCILWICGRVSSLMILSSHPFFLCMYMSLCFCICSYVCKYIHMWRPESMSGIFLGYSPACFVTELLIGHKTHQLR